MIIANPIYDVTFKRLLENDRAAKFFIGAILDCEVLSLVPTTQEHTDFDEKARKVTLFRMDFAATIKTKGEGEKRVIIEMQKANLFDDVYRFRRYLGKEYAVSKLPIITIYILGFPLSVDSPAFGNVPSYHDLLTNEEIVVRDRFVEHLTHSAYFVQTTRIKPSLNTKLDKLLSIFEQNNFIGDSKTTKDYSLAVDDPEVKAVIDVLQYVAADPTARKELEKERYYQETVEDMFGESDRKLTEAVRREEEAIRQKEDAIRQKEDAIRQQFETARELKFVEKMPIPKIAKITKLTEAEIENL